MCGGAALCDRHQDAAVVAPRVEVGARQRLGSRKRERSVNHQNIMLLMGT